MSCTSKTERIVIEALKATGHPFEIARGSKHNKVILAGKQIGVLTIGGNSGRGRDHKQMICAIKRRLRELNS